MDNKNKKKNRNSSPGKRAVKKTPVKKGGGSNTPFYILVIFILITVIVLLLNRYYEAGRFSMPFKIVSNDADKDAGKKVKTETSTGGKGAADNLSVERDRTVDLKEQEKKEIPERDVNIYLLMLDDKTEKIYMSPVKRRVPEKQMLALALDKLIEGPTAREKNRGYITAVPLNLKVRSIEIKGKTAEIDFSGAIEEGAAGDILLKRINQLVYTATQFDEVDSVIIRINGQRRKTIGSDGYSIGGPLRRQ